MFNGVAAMVNGLVANAQTVLTPAVVALSLLIGGLVWATGNTNFGKSMVVAALIGGVIMLLAISIATALMALPRA